MTAGQDFVKKIRPAGAALFLILFVLVLITCFTARPDPLYDYKAPHDAAYYTQSDAKLSELKTELETNVFPKLDGEEQCAVKKGKLEITIDSKNFKASRSALLEHFDAELFEFVGSSS